LSYKKNFKGQTTEAATMIFHQKYSETYCF